MCLVLPLEEFYGCILWLHSTVQTRNVIEHTRITQNLREHQTRLTITHERENNTSDGINTQGSVVAAKDHTV